MLDTDDTLSFINLTNDKAIKLIYDSSKESLIDYWLSNFGDEGSGSVALDSWFKKVKDISISKAKPSCLKRDLVFFATKLN